MISETRQENIYPHMSCCIWYYDRSICMRDLEIGGVLKFKSSFAIQKEPEYCLSLLNQKENKNVILIARQLNTKRAKRIKYRQMSEVIISRTDHTDILVITMETSAVSKEYVSLMKRTLEAQLYNEMAQDYGFPRAICRSLVDLFFSYYNLYLGADRTDGQLIYRAVPADVPPGVKTEDVKTHPVRLTLYSQEDIYAISKSVEELTKHRIIRLANEAFDQDGLRTHADLAVLTGVSTRTIGRKIKELHDEDIIIPTRGSRMDIS